VLRRVQRARVRLKEWWIFHARAHPAATGAMAAGSVFGREARRKVRALLERGMGEPMAWERRGLKPGRG
jgi:hypothetical protein